ncbi:hypothetical protein PIB30_009513 [Stylosanthes scabra]|uniref:Zinc finger GRF-type domain-containing protein n=1 Tax=Stylosanthes scabra TaxID=79078 RepID=A0ABU6Y5P9_9FABA|nr:hypothetical protein [Stylosanthes scabra]
MSSDACLAGSVTVSRGGNLQFLAQFGPVELRQRMQVNNSQGSRSRSRTQSAWARTSSRGGGSKVPQWCGCGLRPVLRWSGTELNPDRPFYGCPNYNVDGKEDEAIARRTQCETKVDPLKINLGWRVSKLEDEIRVLRGWILGLSIVMMVVLFGIVGNCLGLSK